MAEMYHFSASTIFLISSAQDFKARSFFLALSQIKSSRLERRLVFQLLLVKLARCYDLSTQVTLVTWVLSWEQHSKGTEIYKEVREREKKTYVNKFTGTQIHMTRLVRGEQNGRWVACR